MDFPYYVKTVLEALRVRPFIGGLEIADSALRFVSFDGKAWHMTGVRMPPGVMERNQIKDPRQFQDILRTLREQILKSAKSRKKINVVASLSSVNIFSQVFSLPLIEGENLEKAIQLNIQMVSPIETEHAYSGWQLVGEDPSALRLEILSALINRSVVDEITKALAEAGFLVIAIESRALSLIRLARQEVAGFDVSRPSIVVSLDNTGLDFLIIRSGQLYFEYFHPWRDLQDEKGQISLSAFEMVLIRNLHQVLNFYSQHWVEPLQEVFLSAVGLHDEMLRTIKENFSLAVNELTLKIGQPIRPEWFVALGSSLRGLVPRREDKEISLLGVAAAEEFRQEQLVSFLNFWEVLLPVTLSLLLVGFVASDIFLINTRRALESQSLFRLSPEQTKEVDDLEARAQAFNRLVALVQGIERSQHPTYAVLDRLTTLMKTNGMTLSRLSFQSFQVPATLSGFAKSEDQILSFKKALESDSRFQNVNLPWASIQSGPDGVSFSMSFIVTP